MNEARIMSRANVAVKITKVDQKKEFLIEGGYTDRDDLFKPIMAYPFAGWETWEEIEPVALEHLKTVFEHSRMKRQRMDEIFNQVAISDEETLQNVNELIEDLKKDGRYNSV